MFHLQTEDEQNELKKCNYFSLFGVELSIERILLGLAAAAICEDEESGQKYAKR
jgi:hypothetical protein